MKERRQSFAQNILLTSDLKEKGSTNFLKMTIGPDMCNNFSILVIFKEFVDLFCEKVRGQKGFCAKLQVSSFI